MKTINIFLFIVILPIYGYGQDFFGMSTYSRIYNINYEKSSGTTFLIEKDSSNYFVTAKHLFKTKKYGDIVTVRIYQDNEWKYLTGKLLFHKNPNIDIALIEPDDWKFVDGISLDSPMPIPGDEGFFFGFPFGIRDTLNRKINYGFPLPLVKKAVLSGSLGSGIILLDGHNNPGFSGGPVYFKNRLERDDYKWYLQGVISSYVNDSKLITIGDETIKFNENSGIIIAYTTQKIIEILAEK